MFAFTLQSGSYFDSPELINEPPESFKEKYEKLLKDNFSAKFDFSNSFPELRQDFPNSDSYDLLNSKKEGTRRYFLLSSLDQSQNQSQPKPLYRLLAYPQKLSDTYALLINIFRPQAEGFDRVPLSEVGKFNPNQCLTLAKDPHFIGQTLLITAYLPKSKPANAEALRTDAEKLLKQLLGACPEFYQADKFLDSYILEFSRPKTSQTRYLVLFYLTDSTPKKLKKIYWDLPELFLYYHKITNGFQQSRKYADEIDQLIREKIESQSKLPESLNLDVLKNQLKEILKVVPEYTLQLRHLEDTLNTLNIHARNYQRTLKRLQDQANDPLQTQTNYNLDFFSRFAERESQTFQLQIQADINYAKPGSQLLDQAIASIRGLVEIDQAESDRISAQAEKERDRNQAERDRISAQAEKKRDRDLQNRITIIGVGIGVAGVTATAITDYIKEAEPPTKIQFFPWNSSPHPITKSISISLLIGALASVGTFVLIDLVEKLWRLIKPPSSTESPESKQSTLPSCSTSEMPAPTQQAQKVGETLPANSDKT
ncbi:hypothetical protein [Microcoleus sp. FACHB-68]|uniref:hypothetical protein n=1 Tax=Microcoleus sp. FACHB-68 TaxID=2692826 RepID=UPI0016850635|nr:hypothetical protein [Microcoleus sp. FACHB-68]MBD1936778.1 hypothetical protein [Microcoleus sp. FACHB-68]